ncbi:hypothetical protein FGO68_gene12371 [Halteria grandinella]|uniref:Uncharacterized protein n=1 Tax=Halteria grandinella TaxID=5974 RepID=A0A8J8P402_HALGN|nr:hypothetical protein FGO68_gene12371 [Halteria grandinella]
MQGFSTLIHLHEAPQMSLVELNSIFNKLCSFLHFNTQVVESRRTSSSKCTPHTCSLQSKEWPSKCRSKQSKISKLINLYQ